LVFLGISVPDSGVGCSVFDVCSAKKREEKRKKLEEERRLKEEEKKNKVRNICVVVSSCYCNSCYVLNQ